MKRRALFKYFALPALMAVGAAGYSRARAGQNPYYQGPPSDHFDGLRFFLPGQPPDKGIMELLRWNLGGGREAWPDSVPSPFSDKPPARVEGLRVAMVGHATLLIQVAGLNILTDPVYAERASPFAFAGPRRANPPGIAFDDLPPIDAVLVTHNHYDHLDTGTIARLWHRDRPRIVAPLGNDAIIKAADESVAVTTADWDETVELSPAVTARLLPSYHWSARWTNDRRMALWCAYHLATPAGAVYHVGDTGYGDGRLFREVRERLGPPRLAILPIGAYEPRWFMKPQHMNPEEAVQVMRDLGAEQALGHHWGTFRLTNEGAERPVEALAAALQAAGVAPARFRALRPGEVWAAGEA